MDSADLTLATTEVDEEYYYQHDLEHHQVHNWWGDYYKGTVTYRQAIEQSMNIIAVKTLNKIGINLGFEYCEKFGLSTLTEDDAVESLALGGISHGVYNYELTAAYASIANGGVYNKPSLYTKVLDHDGNVLIDNSNPESHTVIKDTTAALLTNAMQDVVTKGTATDAQLNNMPASGKSGTTSDNRDFWFEGFTPYYTCGIWMGYDGNQEMSEGSWNYHFKIWAKIMNRIDEALGLTYKDFEMPGSLVQKSVCTISGKLAGSGCPSQVTLPALMGILPVVPAVIPAIPAAALIPVIIVAILVIPVAIPVIPVAALIPVIQVAALIPAIPAAQILAMDSKNLSSN